MSKFSKRKGWGVLNGQKIDTNMPKVDIVDLTLEQSDIYIDYLEMQCLHMQGNLDEEHLDLMKMREKEILSWRSNDQNWLGDKLV